MEHIGDERKRSYGQRRNIGYTRSREAGQGGVLAARLQQSGGKGGLVSPVTLQEPRLGAKGGQAATSALAESFVDWGRAATVERWGQKPEGRLIKQGR